MSTMDQRILELIKKYMGKLFHKKVLTTMEEVEASTNETNLVAAPVVAALNNKLGGFEPICDASGKITGYKTDIGGADTVFPFRSGSPEVVHIIGAGSNAPWIVDNDYSAMMLIVVSSNYIIKYMHLDDVKLTEIMYQYFDTNTRIMTYIYYLEDVKAGQKFMYDTGNSMNSFYFLAWR